MQKLKDRGYDSDIGPNCYKLDGIGRSTDAKSCAEEFMEYYLGKDDKILLSCGGGELMCEILDYMDFEKLKASRPKWFMGYSDNTNMTFLLTTICDTASIYGPQASAFGMEIWHKSITDAMEILEGKRNVVTGYDGFEKESLKSEETPLAPYNITEKSIIKKYECIYDEKKADDVAVKTDSDVNFEGRLLGGCMDCLTNLAGTKFDCVNDFIDKYKEDGIIWFLEACDLNVMSIRRTMWNLDSCGWFRNVKGFIIGRPLCMLEDTENGASMMGLNQYDAVLDVIKKYNVPVVMDADVGHIAPMMPIVCGAYGKVKTEGTQLKIEMEYR